MARTLLGTKSSAEEASVLRKQLGLGEPFAMRITKRFTGACSGNFGESYVYHKPVMALLNKPFKSTLKIVCPALAIGTFMGILMGIWVAYNPSRFNKMLLALSTSIAFLPSLALSTLVVYGLGYKLNLISPSYFWAVAIITLIPLFVTALTTFHVYASLLSSDCIRSARSLGFSEGAIAFHYGFKIALIPLVSNFTNIALYLLTATVFVEITFALPGIGSLLLAATERLDFPVIGGVSFVVVIFFGIMNLVTGIAVYALDPKTR